MIPNGFIFPSIGQEITGQSISSRGGVIEEEEEEEEEKEEEEGREGVSQCIDSQYYLFWLNRRRQ